MSVFQLQEWWSIKVSDSEEFDSGCMVVGNIDNADPPAEKITVGSLQGMLRIYNPTRPQFRVEDLILEENLGIPILQLLIGHFIPSTSILGLAVLHPFKLVVYEIVAQANKDGRVNFYSLRKAYTHDLGLDGKHFTAYNMSTGNFGGSKDRDMIVVQSLDGKLQIFEQSANAFTRQIVDCLIPGPIAYIPKIDAFVTVNHACQADCYRYQVLASSQKDLGGGAKETDGKNSGYSAGLRPAMVEWSMLIGEPCRQIAEGYFSVASDSTGGAGTTTDSRRRPSELLMLCDKSLFLLKGETGGLMQQRRLDRSDASCMCVIPNQHASTAGGGTNFVLASMDATVQIFSGFNLVWAAKLMSVPVHMAVSTFGNQKGLIVCIDDAGYLSINYLGTKPPTAAVMKQVRELDYDQVEVEHRSLLQVIRESQSDQKSGGDPQDRLFIKPQYPRTIELTEQPAGGAQALPPLNQLVSLHSGIMGNENMNHSNGPFVRIMIRLFLSYSNNERPATNISLTVDAPSFAHVAPSNVMLPRVSGSRSTPQMVKVFLYATKNSLPTSLDAVVTASYTNHAGEPRVTTIPLELPLYLAAKPKAPLKNATYKVILDTGEHNAAQPLTELFGDFLYAYQTAGVEVGEILGGNNAMQAMGFQLFAPCINIEGNGSSTLSSAGPAVVSILVSKNAGRYRVQSDSYSAMLVIVKSLEKRLQSKLAPIAADGSNANAPSVVKCTEALPLDNYFSVIQAHFNARTAIQALSSQLNDVAHQYRMIEKRLLVRFKDRNPTALGGLDVIMKESYDKIIALSDQIQAQQEHQKRCAKELDCFSKYIALVSSMKYDFTLQERQMFRSFLCPDLREGAEQGWEETVNASITYLLKTSLAKQAKETTNLSGSALELPTSIDTLKKHLLLLFDRLDKGGRIIASGSGANGSNSGGSGGGLGGAAQAKSNHGSSSKSSRPAPAGAK